MLRKSAVSVILPVTDLQRARNFYGNVLGLREAGTVADGGILYKAGRGATLLLSPRSTPTRAEHTALSFEVEDIENVISALSERRVRFEDYDLPGLKTHDKVCVMGSEKAAWFKDTEGNILCLHEDLGSG